MRLPVRACCFACEDSRHWDCPCDLNGGCECRSCSFVGAAEKPAGPDVELWPRFYAVAFDLREFATHSCGCALGPSAYSGQSHGCSCSLWAVVASFDAVCVEAVKAFEAAGAVEGAGSDG